MRLSFVSLIFDDLVTNGTKSDASKVKDLLASEDDEFFYDAFREKSDQ